MAIIIISSLLSFTTVDYMNLAASTKGSGARFFFWIFWLEHLRDRYVEQAITIHYDYFQPKCIPLWPQFTFPSATVAEALFFEQETIKFLRELHRLHRLDT